MKVEKNTEKILTNSQETLTKMSVTIKYFLESMQEICNESKIEDSNDIFEFMNSGAITVASVFLKEAVKKGFISKREALKKAALNHSFIMEQILLCEVKNGKRKEKQGLHVATKRIRKSGTKKVRASKSNANERSDQKNDK